MPNTLCMLPKWRLILKRRIQNTVTKESWFALVCAKYKNGKVETISFSANSSTRYDRHNPVNEGASDNVSIIGEASIPESYVRILNKGPKFIPAQKLNVKIANELKISLAHSAYQLRWKTISDTTFTGRSFDRIRNESPFLRFCPFEGNRRPPPKATAEFERKLQVLNEAIERLINRELAKPSFSHNTSYSDHQALKQMKKDDNIYIPSDKGGEMVVMTLAHYKSCLLYTSPSPRDLSTSRMPSSA